MSFKLLTSLAAVIALTACESTEETRSGMHDWPTTSTTVEGPVPGSVEDFQQNNQDRVFFGLNKSNITHDAANVLKGQAEWAAKYPSVGLMLAGHCDERGTREYNLALGERRAHAAKKTLVAHGVESSRIETVSYGKEQLTGKGHDEDRRVVTSVR